MTDGHLPTIIPREKHCISRNNISPNALKVLYRLKEAGYAAYLVGGGVRDLLLGMHPKDFDVATAAHPEEIKKLFRNCILIGRRFRLAHIRFGREIIEVATFRGEHENANHEHAHTTVNGMIVRDNVFGTFEEDAWRRDFTVNALYYNIADFSVVDYCGGMYDLQHKILKIIGDPIQRYQEDPVRLLRAIRFAAKLNFKIDAQTAEPIKEMSYLLAQVPPARIFEETLKLFLTGTAAATFELLIAYDLLKQLFPATALCIQHNTQYPTASLLAQAMQNSDSRVAEGKSITPVFLLAVFLWHPLLAAFENEKKEHYADYLALEAAMRHTLKNQIQIMTIPKRLTAAMQEIWRLQFRLQKAPTRTAGKILTHPRFRAAYDFLLLRASIGDPVQEQAHWWTQFHDGNEQERQALLKQTVRHKRSRRKR